MAALRFSQCIFKRCLGNFASSQGAKVAVCGASGGIGQPLSLLLKQIPLVNELSLYDIKGAVGVAADLSHINTDASVVASGDDIYAALKGSDIVVIPAGMPRKPGMTRDDLFKTNASICASIVDKIALICPRAMICIVTNPVNSTVPIASEVLKHRGVYDRARLFGVTTLDVVRANTFVAQLKNFPVGKVNVPVVAGHSGDTIVPLLSQATPKCSFTQEELINLVSRIQNAGTEVVEAKAGAGSATLSMAFAANRFVSSLLAAMAGEKGVVECTLTDNQEKGTYPKFFSFPCLLGPNGIEKRLDLGNPSNYEMGLMEKAKEEMEKNIHKGIEFGMEYSKKLI